MLRDYQIDLYNKIKQEIKNGARSVLAVSPCGSGKTTLGVEILLSAQQKGNSSAVIGHKDIIIDQWMEQLPGARLNQYGKLSAWSIWTLYNYYKQIKPYDLILSDEAHLNAARTHEETLNYLKKNGSYIIGMTATPNRFDGHGLDCIYDVMVEGPTARELIAAGYLVPPIEYIIDEPDLSGIDIDNNRKVVAERMRRTHVTGDVVKSYLKYAKGKRFALFPVTVDYGRSLIPEFSESGINVELITGETPTAERMEIITRLEAGTTHGVISYDCISEGMNVPGIECIIDCNPTESLSKYIQRNSRGGRPASGKSHYIILDLSGNFFRHGHVYADHNWSLKSRKKNKVEQTERALSFARCMICFRPYDINLNNCPYCQADKEKRERKIRTRTGSLKIVTESEYYQIIKRLESEEQRKKDKAERTKQFKRARWACKTLEECIDVYRKYGYNVYGARKYFLNRRW